MADKIEKLSHMEALLTCSICTSTLENPHTLKECLHSFCKKCLDGLTRQEVNSEKGVECPVCCTFSEEKSLSPSSFINGLTDIQSRSNDKQKCDCDEKADVTCHCCDCKMPLCDKCKQNHSRFPTLKSHKIVPLDEKEKPVIDELIFCGEHPDEPVKFNCKSCEVLLCIKCKVADHEMHKAESVEAALERLLPLVMGNKEKVEANVETLDDQIRQIDEKITETKEVFSQCLSDLQKDANEKVKAIREEETQIAQEIEESKEHELSKLEESKINLQHKLKTMRNLKSLVDVSLDNARNTSLLQEIQGGLLQHALKWGKKINADTSLKVKYPEYEPLETDQDNLGDILYKNSRVHANVLPNNHRDFTPEGETCIKEIEKWKNVGEIKLENYCNRMAVVDGQLWFPSCSSKKIEVYKPNGTWVRTISTYIHPASAAQRKNGNVIVACISAGLYEMSLDGEVLSLVMPGKFCDVAVNDKSVFAFNYVTHQIFIFKDSTQESLDFDCVIRIPGISTNLYNTILATNDVIYVSSFIDRHVSYFELDNLRQIGRVRLEIPHPSLCGIDQHGHILVASCDSKMLYCWDGGYNWRELPIEAQHVTDAVVDTGSNLWLVDCNSRQVLQFRK